MVAFDTNVLVRVLVSDDPAQTRAAERAFVRHASDGGIFVSLIVLVETAWVLDAGYGWRRAAIHERLARLVRTRGIAVEELELVEAALEAYREGRADFADHLIVGSARRQAAPLLTFDRKLARAGDGVTLLGARV